MNTRQQTMNTPDDILSDKIKEDTDLNMHQSWQPIRDHAPTGDDITRCQNMTTWRKSNTYKGQSTSHRSTDQHRVTRHIPSQDEPWPCIPRRGQRHIPGQVCIHMTHRTNTSMHFTLFHPNCLHHWHWQRIYKMDIGTDMDTWQQASIHIFSTSLYYGCIRPHFQNSI